MAKDIRIIPGDGEINFTNAAGEAAGSITLSGDDLVLSNALGNVLFGDVSSDVYIGDGINNVDIIFEKSGEIRAETGVTGVTLTIGSSNTTVTIVDPDLTGSPTAPTAAAGTNTTQIATTAFVSTAVSNLVDSAPGTLNTLNELAAALGDDASFSTTVSTALGNRLRVDTASQNLTATEKSNARTNLGLGSAATSASTDFAAASHTHSYLPLSGGTLTGTLRLPWLWSSTDLTANTFYVKGNSDQDGFAFGVGTTISTWFSWDNSAGLKRAIDVWNDGSKILLGYGGHDVEVQNDLYVPAHIFHTGDTDTYMQFHAADEWRVVTGGAERLEVNSTATTITNVLVLKGQVDNYDGSDRSSYWDYDANVALALEPAADNGATAILFKSVGNSPSDFAYIAYDEDYPEAGVTAGEVGALILSAQNDGTGSSDHVRVKSRLVVEADMSSSDPTYAFQVKSSNVTTDLFSVKRDGTVYVGGSALGTAAFANTTAFATSDLATGTSNGLMSSTDKEKLDGIDSGANNYSLPLGTSTTRGGFKVGYTESGKNYPVELSNEQMYVNVPWTDTNTTYSTATSTTLGLVKIGYTENGKNYPVELSSGQMFVNVPWTDTNTTYSVATTTANGLMSSTDKSKLDGIAANANNYVLPFTDNSDNWDIAYGWGDHDGLYAAASHAHSASDITSGTLDGARIPEWLEEKYIYVSNDSNGVYMPMVKGGMYAASTSSVTGAIKVTLPAYKSNMMFTIYVDIYEYTTGETVTLRVSGYAYNDTGATWHNCSVINLADNSDRDYNVRFYSDTTNSTQYFAIGETNSTWSYPQVMLRDFWGGYQTSESEAQGTWSVDFVTSFTGDLRHTFSGNFVAGDWDNIRDTPTTLSGYGITDAATSAQGAKADSALQSIAANSIGAAELNVSGNGTTAQYLRSDSDGSFTWATPTNTTYSTATSTTLGLVKIGYTESGKNYPVELSNEQMYVNVPWTDTNTTYSAGTGISLSGTTFNVDYPVRVLQSQNYAPSDGTATGNNATNRANFGTGLTIYEGYSTGSNRPFTYDTAAQFMVNANQGFEFAIDWVSGSSTPIKIRSLRDCCQGWSSWSTIWTSSTDGSGSGLDADLLDGNHASDFALSAHSHSDATTSASGFMSSTDKSKLDGIASNANNYSLPSDISVSSVTIGAGVTLSESSDRADLLYINSSTSGWGGLQIGNTSNEFIFSLMGDGTTGGIYDDQNGDWLIQWTENGGVRLYQNGGQRLETTSTGITVSGSTLINDGNSQGGTNAFSAYDRLLFSNSHSDTARGPNKITMYDNGTSWQGGFGIHSGTVSYYSGDTHKWYKSGASSTFTQQMALDGSANLTIGGAFTGTKLYLNDSNTLIQEGANNSVNISTGTGSIDIGSMNASWVHFQADRDIYILPSTGGKVAVDGDLIPYADNASKLGASSYRWAAVYGVTGVFSGDVVAYSDARVKENIETIETPLDKVMKLRGVSFNKTGEERKSIGVIAQEIREVLPEVVHEQEDGMLAVSYGNIVGLLIEAMKEQQQQIEELKSMLGK